MGWCNQLGGMVPFPKTQNQSLELINMLKKAIKGKYACEHFWMPIVQTLKPDEAESSEHKNNAHSEGSHDSGGHKRKRGASSSDEKSEDSEMELKKLSKIKGRKEFIWTNYFDDKSKKEIKKVFPALRPNLNSKNTNP